jgi:PKD repeat protein
MRTKRNILFLLLITGIFFESFSFAKINLSLSSTDSITPNIAIDSQGRILALWIEMDWPLPGIADVLYTTRENGQWSEIKETVSQLYDARNPHLITDSNGKPHLTYDDGKSETTRDIFYRSFSFEENHWSNIQRVYLTNQNSSNPKIGVDKDAKIYVMWAQQYGQDAENKIVINSKNEAEIWPETFEDISRNKNSSANHPCFAVRDGNISACWMDNRDGGWDLFYNEKINAEWKTPTKLNNSGEIYWPSLAQDKEGNIHIICSSKEGNIFYVKKANQTWSSPLIISTGFSPTRFSDLRLFKDNTLHSVWIQETASDVSILYGRATSEGNWLEPIQIPVGKEADHPKIELDDSGNAHIVWEDVGLNNKKDVFYTTVTPSGSKPIAVFSSSEDSGIVPHTVDFDASGSLPGEEKIRSYWWDFGDGSEMEEGCQISHTYNKAGIFPVKLYVTNRQLLVGFRSNEIHVLSGPFPPLNILVKKTEERGLFYREKINAITWEENPKNKAQVLISHYNIYRKLENRESAEFKIIGHAFSSTYKYADRDFLSPEERDSFSYAISAVDDMGREGPMGFALSLEPDGEKKASKSMRKEIK